MTRRFGRSFLLLLLVLAFGPVASASAADAAVVRHA